MIKKLVPLIAVFLMSLMCVPTTMSAVYKWVDKDGNVHFSDDPQDAEKGEQVTYDSLNVLEGGEELAASASKNRERIREEQEKTSESAAEPQEVYNPCKEDLDTYDKYTGLHQNSNGVPVFYYAEDENGKALSQRAQNELVRELESDLKQRGCL